jgi:hypothetical protein
MSHPSKPEPACVGAFRAANVLLQQARTMADEQAAAEERAPAFLADLGKSRRIHRTFTADWDDGAKVYVGKCNQFPDLSWRRPIQQEALDGIMARVAGVDPCAVTPQTEELDRELVPTAEPIAATEMLVAGLRTWRVWALRSLEMWA